MQSLKGMQEMVLEMELDLLALYISDTPRGRLYSSACRELKGRMTRDAQGRLVNMDAFQSSTAYKIPVLIFKTL